jgi:hypothetical protein
MPRNTDVNIAAHAIKRAKISCSFLASRSLPWACDGDRVTRRQRAPTCCQKSSRSPDFPSCVHSLKLVASRHGCREPRRLENLRAGMERHARARRRRETRAIGKKSHRLGQRTKPHPLDALLVHLVLCAAAPVVWLLAAGVQSLLMGPPRKKRSGFCRAFLHAWFGRQFEREFPQLQRLFFEFSGALAGSCSGEQRLT